MVTASKKGKGIAPGSKKDDNLTAEEKEERAKIIQQEMNEKFSKEKEMFRLRKPSLVGDSIKLLRKGKAEDIKKFVRFLVENYEKEMNKQQHLIEVYFEDFKKCKLQQDLVTGTHSDYVEDLICLFQKSKENIENQFLHFFDIMSTDFEASVKRITQFWKKKEVELTKILKDFEERDTRERKVMDVNFMTDADVLCKRYSKFFEVMKIEMGKVVKSITRSYDDLMKFESRRVGGLFSQYRIIKKEDIITKGKINEQVKNLKITREKNNEWKAKHLNNLKNFQKRNNLIKTEILQVKGQYRVLKRKMSRFQKGEKKRLLRLVKLTTSARNDLQSKARLACRILQRNGMLEPLETEKERNSFMKYNDQFTHDGSNDTEEAKKKKEEMKKEWNFMKRYYRKVNRVTLSTDALEREREMLVKRNRELRKKLTVYINGISVNPQIMSEKNSLLIQQKINLHNRMPCSTIKTIML